MNQPRPRVHAHSRLNTWHNNGPWLWRRDALVQGIIQYAPDILLLQEFFDADWSNELQARLGFPYLVSTQCVDSGLVVLSKLAAQRSEIYRMKIKSPFETYSRYALWAELDSGGYRLSVFNTHLSWELQDGATRQAQVGELWSFIEKHRADSGFTVVAGDFNCTPNSLAMTWLINHSGFADTYAILHPVKRDLLGAIQTCLRKIIGRFFPSDGSITCLQIPAL